ncbi:MAG TPA: class II fructose-bisphosphate aldolase, partial [Magnetovibrio sp.]
MPLVHMKDMLRHAYENEYAVGAFDVVNLDMLQGIINAAEACRAPVILGISEPHLVHFSLDTLAPAVEAVAKNSNVPVAIHFDHATNLENVVEGIRRGCNSFMIDGSSLELQSNIDLTKDAVKIARTCGVHVEAELGYVPDADSELIYTSASEAAGFVRYTEVDSLAVSIGTVHGKFKGKPKLDFTRLRQINEAVGIPLVLHGSSGLSDEQFHRLTSNGIAKINYFTALTNQAEQLLRSNAKETN